MGADSRGYPACPQTKGRGYRRSNGTAPSRCCGNGRGRLRVPAAAEEIRRTARKVRRGPVRAVDGRARARYLLPDLAVRGEQHRRVGALQDDGLGETVEDDEAQQVAAALLVDLHRLQQLGP